MKNQESSHEKFKRLAMLRTNGVISKLRTLTKLSNPRQYHYNKDDMDKIFKAIHNDLKICKAMFEKNLIKEKFEL